MVDTGGRTSRYVHLGRGLRGRGRTRETVNANEDEGLGWRTIQGGSGPPTWRNSSRRAGWNTSRSAVQRPHPIGPGPGRVPRLIGSARTQDVGFSPISRDTYYQDHRHAAGNIMVTARAAKGDGDEAVMGHAAMWRRTFATEKSGGRGHQNAGRAGSLEKPASRAWTTWAPKMDSTRGEARYSCLGWFLLQVLVSSLFLPLENKQRKGWQCRFVPIFLSLFPPHKHLLISSTLTHNKYKTAVLVAQPHTGVERTGCYNRV